MTDALAHGTLTSACGVTMHPSFRYLFLEGFIRVWWQNETLLKMESTHGSPYEAVPADLGTKIAVLYRGREVYRVDLLDSLESIGKGPDSGMGETVLA